MAKPKKISKNNPDARENGRLVVYDPVTKEEMKIVKRVPGGMFYVSPSGNYYPCYKGSYKEYEYEWKDK